MRAHRHTYDRTRGVWVSNPDPIDADAPIDVAELILAAVAFTVIGLVVGVCLVAVGVILEAVAATIGWEGLALGSAAVTGIVGTVAAILRPAIIRRPE